MIYSEKKRKSDSSRHRHRYTRFRRRSASSWVVALFVLTLLSGVAWYSFREPVQSAAEMAPPPSSAAFVLKLNGPITPSSAGTLVAIADGMFQREGLNVELRSGTSDADVTSNVASDDHVIGLASAHGFLKARADGLPIVAFAASFVASSLEFFALSDTRLLGPADLEGKRIGYKPGPEVSTVLHEFIARNSIAQSGLKIVESDDAASDLLGGRIDVMLGHRDVEGQTLERSNVPYRSLSPDSFGVHAMGPVYFANQRSFSSPANLEKLLVAIANGWNSAYSDYHRTIPIIARSIDGESDSTHISRFMDTQRRFLRPSGARFGELDPKRLKNLQEQLLQQRIIRQPTDLTRAVNSSILTELYRTKADVFSGIEP